MGSSPESSIVLLETTLHGEHVALGAKMAGFAGYDMPLHYTSGALQEHNWTRSHTGVFDASHMGVIHLRGLSSCSLLGRISLGEYEEIMPMHSRYTVLLNQEGGIIDDMIVTKISNDYFVLVVNASRKDVDFAYIQLEASQFPGVVAKNDLEKAIIAVQGQEAEVILGNILGCDLSQIDYMTAMYATYHNESVMVTRTGYTGEDGFEVILPSSSAVSIWRDILSHECARPVGLVARDSLRLEVGYPLYGADLDESISPWEASLGWLLPKNQPWVFYGADRVANEKNSATLRKRVGLLLEGKGVLRSGLKLFDAAGHDVGQLSSGGYSPILKRSIGMAYVPADVASSGELQVDIYGAMQKISVVKFPFVSTKVRKGKKI